MAHGAVIKENNMWTVIYIAQKQAEVETLRAQLEEHKIIVRVHRLSGEQTEAGDGYAVLVPAAEVSAAHEIMFDADF